MSDDKPATAPAAPDSPPRRGLCGTPFLDAIDRRGAGDEPPTKKPAAGLRCTTMFIPANRRAREKLRKSGHRSLFEQIAEEMIEREREAENTSGKGTTGSGSQE